MNSLINIKGFFTTALVFIALTSLGTPQTASAASGEMGIGVPEFGFYSSAATPPNGQTIIFSLAGATLNFPAGCSQLTLIPGSMGMDTYKLAAATLLTSKATGKKVRFYAHAPRDAGCGIDFIQLLD